MKPRPFLCFSLLLFAGTLFAQTNSTPQKTIPIFDPGSQSNLVVIVNCLDSECAHPSCPVEYTNLVSNTNLFSPVEQKLLKEIPLKYKNVTTNSGPPESVLVGLDKTNGNWVAHFQYTNSEAQDEVVFHALPSNGKLYRVETQAAQDERAFGRISAKFRTKVGDGYDVKIARGSVFDFQQIKQNIRDGLVVGLDGDYCGNWMRFINGKAVGKWFVWDRDGNLIIEVEFKKPFDFDKYAQPVNL
jgi:hypothetical protein